MTGFDVHGGRFTPRIEGVVVFKEDEIKLLVAYADYAEKEKEREINKALKAGKKLWIQLIRKILVRKYISKKYDN